MKLKKRICAVLAALLLALCATGCGANGGDTVYLSFPTASTSGTIYAVSASLANLWNSQIDGVQVSVESSNGGVQNLNLMAAGEAQLGVAVTSIITEQKNGTGTFEGHAYDGTRILTALYMNYNQMVVRSDAGIDTVADVKGKRFAPGAPGSTTTLETELHFNAAGVHYPDDLEVSFVGFTEAVELIRNKQMDGAWIMAGIPTSAVSEICTTAGGQLVSMDEELVNAMTAAYPWYNRAVIPAGTYEGQTEDVVTTGVTICIFIDESVSDEVAYQLARVMYENLDSITSVHNALKDLTAEGAVQNLAGLPLHDGAAKYYKEIGLL